MALKIMNGLDLQSQKITGLADPSSNTDAVTKQYADNLLYGSKWKNPVRVATTATGTLASAYANGQTIDGVTLVTGDRILIKDQSTGSENGIYVVAATGAPTRATDADSSTTLQGSDLSPGTTVYVTEGTTNGDKAFAITSNAAITIGTTATTWGQIGGGQTYTASNGVSLSTNNFSGVVVASGGLTVGASGFAVDTTLVARKFSTNIGNGLLTTITVNHNLNTQDVVVSVRDTTLLAGVLVDWAVTDNNNITVTFATAPANNAFRVTVVG